MKYIFMRLNKKLLQNIHDKVYKKQTFQAKYNLVRKKLKKLDPLLAKKYTPRDIRIFAARTDKMPRMEVCLIKKTSLFTVKKSNIPKIKQNLEKKSMRIVRTSFILRKKPIMVNIHQNIRKKEIININFDILKHITVTESNENTENETSPVYDGYSINLYNSNKTNIVALSIKYKVDVFFEKSDVLLRSKDGVIRTGDSKVGREETTKNFFKFI